MSSIALCFLTYDKLNQNNIWNNLFLKHRDKLNIYIHNKKEFIDKKHNTNQYCIKKKIATQYGNISLVSATIKLLKEAYKYENNKYFILLSNSCIPIQTYNYIYTQINKYDTNMFFGTGHPMGKDGQERFYNLINDNFIHYDHWMSQSQWCILKRDTVNFFIENDYTPLFKNMFAPDEHYFINICHKFRIPYKLSNITYVNWDKGTYYDNGFRPYTYNYLDINTINNIRIEGYLFMRKISDKCEIENTAHQYLNSL